MNRLLEVLRHLDRRGQPALVLAALLASPVPAAHADADIRVILLGTGGPELTTDRQGYATLVEAGGEKLLFDAGRGVVQRLYESRVELVAVTRIFLTHLHNDHIEGLPTLWMTPWFLLGRDRPLEVWGPAGTAATMKGMQAMYWFDMEHRVNQFNQLSNLQVAVSETAGGLVYERGGVKVTAFPVWHDDGNPALGYRIEFRNRVVVLSGDTTYSENVVQHGRGADLIVHNVIAMSERLTGAPEIQPVLGKLTTPEQAARVFLEARPRMAVFSHVVKKEMHGPRGDRRIVQRTRQAGYRGPLVMGQDRMVIEIGETVKVKQPASIRDLPDLDRKEVYVGE